MQYGAVFEFLIKLYANFSYTSPIVSTVEIQHIVC